jgi:hypothetical protein
MLHTATMTSKENPIKRSQMLESEIKHPVATSVKVLGAFCKRRGNECWKYCWSLQQYKLCTWAKPTGLPSTKKF